jgi:deoxycytidine triphosphate deaminase
VSVLSGGAVSKFCSSFKKINPNGVDLAPKEVKKIPATAVIYMHGEDRGYVGRGGGGTSLSRKGRPKVSDLKKPLRPDSGGFYRFSRGALYELRFPKVSVPADCTGFAFPRSTINRLGIIKLETAVFDSGYSGEFTQTLFTPLEARVHKDEALVQLVFIRNEAPSELLYDGRYQNEASSSPPPLPR